MSSKVPEPRLAAARENSLIFPSDANEPLLESLHFQHPLRGYQKEILDLVEDKLERGERRMHLVAPPGAGKTIIGLQIISQLKKPSLVLCPNTTIQSQWGQKVHLFLPPGQAEFGTEDLIGTHEDKPLKPITLLTYQVLSTPGREQEYLEKLAHDSWVSELTSGRSISSGEAELRILDLMRNNPNAHQKELSRHVSRLRRRLSEVLDLKDVLHPNALELLQSMRRQKFGVIIFDECHHLTDYWAAIMTHLVKVLGDPVIIGLTGTPPEGKTTSQETRYLSLVGPIDYQVPTPALVKEGGLAPYQDLVYFTEPTDRELLFLEQQHDDFHLLIDELTQPVLAPPDTTQQSDVTTPKYTHSPLTFWVYDKVYQAVQKDVVRFHRLVEANVRASKSAKGKSAGLVDGGKTKKSDSTQKANQKQEIVCPGGWRELLKTQPELAKAFCRYLSKLQIALPRNIDQSDLLKQSPTIDDWMRVLDDFAAHKLKVSPSTDDHKLYERIRAAARKLGYGLTEQGLRKQASPVDRVLAFSNAKPHAVSNILETEYRVLQDRLRAVVVTDFETMSSTSEKSLKGVLGEEAGGAMACLRILLKEPISEFLNPCLCTGSLLLVDNRIAGQFLKAAEEYLKKEGIDLHLILTRDEALPFARISANSSAWQSRLYVGLATAIFERGITKCLIGTRGLFGEGWDSQALNTLIDLTTTTSPVSVKQLRGRSIRIQATDPLGANKVANNWDVVCIAPQLEKGLNDYDRFVRKHDCFFGISDDGHIERGVGHVHPTLSELTPIEVFASFEQFNRDMIVRSMFREKVYERWRVGRPYKNRMLGCVELSGLRKLALTPPHLRRNVKYKDHAGEIRAAFIGVWGEHAALGSIAAAATFFLSHLLGAVTPFLSFAVFISMMYWAKRKYDFLFNKTRKEVCKPNTQESSLYDIGTAVLTALQRRNFIPLSVKRKQIQITVRSDGTYRFFLDGIEPEQSEIFIESFKEAMAPISGQPYLMPKYEYFTGAPDEPPPLSDFDDGPVDIVVIPAVPTKLPEALPKIEQIVSEKEVDFERKETEFFKSYIAGKAQPRIAALHAVPSLLARSEKGREAFESAWNKYVSPGIIIVTESKPEVLGRYFGRGPTLAQRVLWE